MGFMSGRGTRWVSLSSLRVLSLCCWLVSWPDVSHGLRDLDFYLDGDRIEDNGTYHKCHGVSIVIGCYFRQEFVQSSSVHLKLLPDSYLHTEGFDSGNPFYELVGYEVPVSGADGTKSYQCVADRGYPSAVVTVTYDLTRHECSGTTPPTDTPSTASSPSTPSTSSSDSTSSNETPSGGGSTSGSGTSTTSPPTTFKGLKPLIYTVASVILLGTLAIVAIVTCWIRARRSFHSQIIRPNNTPQDYLDYISDNEFTPLTTSEFMASLQERPPTYNQSEEMTQQGTEDEGETPPSSSSSSAQTANIRQDEDCSTNQTQSGDQPTVVVERRRRSRGGSAERRRRRRVVIVEGQGREPQEAITVTTPTAQEGGSTAEGEGGGSSETQPPADQSTAVSSMESEENRSHTEIESTVTVNQLVPVEPISLDSSNNQLIPLDPPNDQLILQEPHIDQLISLGPPNDQLIPLDPPNNQLIPLDPPNDQLIPQDPPVHRLPHTPSQQEIGVIEARVNMVESLSPPPISEHPTTPTGTHTSENTIDNLIDFSLPPPPPPPPSSNNDDPFFNF